MSRKTAPLTEPVSPDATTVLSSLGQLMQWVRRTPLPIDEKFATSMHGARPKPRHIAALLQIAGNERMSVSELADRLSISLATASQLVSDLADLGLVERVEDPADRRRTLIEVSTRHRPLIDKVLNLRLRPLDDALGRLTPDERSGLCRGLQRLASEIESADTEVAS